MINLFKFMKDFITENDGESFCPARVIAISAGCVMIYKFAISATPEYIAFAGGVSAIVSSFAVNKFSEKKNAQSNQPT
jgi:hypothetical protein